MENTAKIIRDLAILYGIEILEEPTGHVFVDENGVESPLHFDNLSKVFGVPSKRASKFVPLNASSCVTIQNFQELLFAQNHVQAIFDSSEDVQPSNNTQYAMAA
jgi:hypothetical protein